MRIPAFLTTPRLRTRTSQHRPPSSIVKSPCFPCQNVWQTRRRHPVCGRDMPKCVANARQAPAISHLHHDNANLVLQCIGSSSAPAPLSRRNLLERLSIPFLVVHPDIDESPLEGETPDALVRRLSEQKALAVGARVGTGLVIGSDQVALLDDAVLGKPGESREQRRSDRHGQRALARISYRARGSGRRKRANPERCRSICSEIQVAHCGRDRSHTCRANGRLTARAAFGRSAWGAHSSNACAETIPPHCSDFR